MKTVNFYKLRADIGRAFRHNLLPGLVLQAIALSLGLLYYFWPPALTSFSFVAHLKARYGLVYAVCATAFFGGVIPFCYLFLTGQTRQKPGKELLFYLLFWGYKGAEVDLFYRLQGLLFGTGNDWRTVAMKTSVDQLCYAAFWMVPTIAVAYLWKDSGFSRQTFRRRLNRVFFTLTIPTIVVSNWLVWLPAVSVIYFMPPNLQVPLYNLVQCFFVLLLHMLGREQEGA